MIAFLPGFRNAGHAKGAGYSLAAWPESFYFTGILSIAFFGLMLVKCFLSE